MKKMVICGGNPLKGEVFISGSKNAALPIMAATLLCDEEIVLENIPRLRDTVILKKLLEKLGKQITFEHSTMKITPKVGGWKSTYQVTYDIVKQMRASICVLGPLLVRYKKAHVSFPGGCVFGPRPIDLHLKAMRLLGSEVTLDHGYIRAKVLSENLVGTEIDLMGEYGSSVLGTANTLMAASLANGETKIIHAACEPEIEDLINFLKKMGADIEGTGTSELLIRGVKSLSGCRYKIIPDRIEAGSFIVFSAMSGGQIELRSVNIEHLKSVLNYFEQMGLNFFVKKDSIVVHPSSLESLKAINVETNPYPLFPTDMQPLFVSLLSCVHGQSQVKDNIYPNRFGYVSELERMGSNIFIEDSHLVVDGVKNLSSAFVQASDLRGGAALVGAALNAHGESHVRRYYHLERGYEDLDKKLLSLGADVKMLDDTLV